MAHETPSMRCECTPVVETTFGGECDRRPSTAITEAVAAVEGVDPTALDSISETINLPETIDPEVIDRLFTNRGNASTPPILLQFSVNEWNVFVRGDGAIRVCDPDHPTGPAPAFQKSLDD